MANVFDYVKWRGDLELSQDSFNEIDSLILSRFAYFPFDNIIKNNETVSIKELGKRFENQDVNSMNILWKDDIEFFPLLANSKRFGNMLATKYINKVEYELEKQFCAITVLLPDDTLYISFRGTDDTIVGWKEDFNMSFKSHVASQVDSVKYLEEISELYPNNIRIGGHSKGGNLAVYASVFAVPYIKSRIINVYNNDGPGFADDITCSSNYKNILDKVHTFIPQSSIVGRLLNHEEQHTIVESNQKGIMQHDLYSWQILGNKFVCLDSLSNDSEFVDKTIKDLLQDIEPAKRQQVIDVLFEILDTTQKETLNDIKANWFYNARLMFNYYRKLDDETKAVITQTLHALIKIIKNNMNNNAKK